MHVQLNNPNGICRQKFFPCWSEVMGERKVQWTVRVKCPQHFPFFAYCGIPSSPLWPM